MTTPELSKIVKLVTRYGAVKLTIRDRKVKKPHKYRLVTRGNIMYRYVRDDGEWVTSCFVNKHAPFDLVSALRDMKNYDSTHNVITKMERIK